ncbi:MAG: hypothetical protein M1827_005783, partial [Pycnora praestabilis]
MTRNKESSKSAYTFGVTTPRLTRSSISPKTDSHLLTANHGLLGGKENLNPHAHKTNTENTVSQSLDQANRDGGSEQKGTSGMSGVDAGEDEDGSAETDEDDEVLAPASSSEPLTPVESHREAGSALCRTHFIGKNRIHRKGLGGNSGAYKSPGKRTFSHVDRNSLSNSDEEIIAAPTTIKNSFAPLLPEKSAKRLSTGTSPRERHKISGEAKVESPPTNKQFQESTETSSDDDYKAVDDISVSEENACMVEREEEENILEEEENSMFPNKGKSKVKRKKLEIPTRRPSMSSNGSDWDGIDFDNPLFPGEDPLDPSFSLDPLFDDPSNFDLPILPDDPKFQQYAASLSRSSSRNPTSRRVQFDIESSDPTSSSSEEDLISFPDLFLDEGSINPGLRSKMEKEQDSLDRLSSTTDGEWDLEGNVDTEQGPVPIKDRIEEEHSSSCGSSSGYETADEGETTDEDLPPASTIAHPRSMLRRQTKAPPSQNTPSRIPLPRIMDRATMRRPGPSMGSWVVDAGKPCVIVNSRGRVVVNVPRSIATNVNARFLGLQSFSSDSSVVDASPRLSLASPADDSEMDRSDISSQDPSPSVLALFAGAPGQEVIPFDQITGPSEAFYSFMNFGADGTLEDPVELDDDQFMEEFINLSDTSSDDDEDQNVNLPPSPTTSTITNLPSTPAKHENVSNAESTALNLLQHFGTGGTVVTAFRQNQARHKQALHGLHRTYTVDGLSSHGKGAIKGGRHAAANIPLTPLRKQKITNHPIPAKAPLAK